jgi:ATP-dependent DNA helicase RecQ
LTPREILKKHWGYDAFRPLQENIIQSVLEGNDTLALLPTGGGKSICFQVPALAREGICIVVSPLIALMKDQVSNLVKRGIKAVAIFSGLSQSEIDVAIDNCIYGEVKFLYLSPERLTSDIIRSRLEKMNVNLLAIDEAHCISQWGYDFRPPYLRIAEIRQMLPDTPTLALTATATPDVMTDICRKLELKNEKIFVKSFERENLIYAVLDEENKMERLMRICTKVGGTGVIYVRNRKKTREIAEYLQKHKITADFYHAGLDAKTRDKKQLNWTSEKTRIIVSTNAFGMGIDKANVRFVVHMDLPDSPEAYFQEAGRAGRDEKKAYAVLLFNKSDIIDIDKYLENAYPAPSYIKSVYNMLGNYLQIAMGGGQNKSYNFTISQFCDHYNMQRITTFNALRFLEKEGYITLSEAFANPSKILILINNEELYRFIVANPSYNLLIKTLLRSYTGLFSEFTRIDEKELAVRLKINEESIKKALKNLHQMRVIHYEPISAFPRITFNIERLNEKDLVISHQNYAERKAFARQRVNAIKNYVTSLNQCRSKMLLEYFGEKNPKNCGQCDICLERRKNNLSEEEFEKITNIIKPLLINNVTLRQLINNLKTDIAEKKIIKTVQWLIDHNKIILDTESETLQWNENKNPTKT